MPLSTPRQSDQQFLQQLAEQMVPACPDMRQMARDTAQSLLNRHGLNALDPDQVYFHRFHTRVSSPNAHFGWAHYDPPYQSLTLPQLVMQRFDVNDQVNADLLDAASGFYKDGPEQSVFDERNEIQLSPQEVLGEFWNVDFSTHFHQQLTAFWHTHADHYRTLAKTHFIAKVMEVCAQSSNSELAKRAREAAVALTGITSWPPTLQALEQTVTPAEGVRLCTFDIGGYIASDILRIQLEDGAELLYTPGENDALHLFANRSELYWWVLTHANTAENRPAFMSHFALSSHAETNSAAGLNHLIDLLYFNWGGDDHHSLNQLDQTLQGDAFSHLRDATRQRMSEDAHFALRSNADLRKQLWIGYLKAFGQVSGALAALDWPVALAAVGAGLAETGLNIEQAINGHTTAQRKAGVIGAVFASINVLFNAAMLASAFPKASQELTDLAEAEGSNTGDPGHDADSEQPASQAELEAWVPEPFQPKPDNQALLAPFETNVILAGEPGSGPLAGIYLDEGRFYALIDDQPYQVRHIAETDTWAVIDPENPYSFYRNVPIRMTPEGVWETMAHPGLKAGGLPRRLLSLWGRPGAGTTVAELPAQPYEIPVSLRQQFKSVDMTSVKRTLSGDYFTTDLDTSQVAEEFRVRRDQLVTDATEYLQTAAQPPRPDIPHLPPEISPKQLFRSLYEKANGVVIGESHSGIGSKRLLIDNMAQLKKQKVKVLYLEHFTTDFEQADLDHFNHTGEMPDGLQRYVQEQDFGHGTDRSGRYTFEHVLLSAQKNGIRLQAIDCYVSYIQAWRQAPSAVIRQQMMNFYAHLIIDADQTVRGASKWIALMGNTHASTFEGVPGVSEMQGAISIRVEDVGLGKGGGISTDPGLSAITQDVSLQHVKADLRLRSEVELPPPGTGDIAQKLKAKGDFSFVIEDDQPKLVHRSRDGGLKYTPILRDGKQLYIENASWPRLNGRRQESLWLLRLALTHSGMHFVPVW